MGLRDVFRLSAAHAPGGALDVTAARIAAPWSDPSTLSTLVWADLLDGAALPIDRAAAMAVPAMARARHLIAGTIASCPLIALEDDARLEGDAVPAWTYRTDGPVSPWHRMLWTVDDLMFGGWSLWRCTIGADDLPDTFDRVPRDEWQFSTDGMTLEDADGKPIGATTHRLLMGPHEGLLTFGARTLRAATDLEASASRHARNPVPSIELHQETDDEISDTERDDLVASWVRARASANGAVGFTSYGIRAYPLGAVPEQLLIDGRNAAAVDVARHVSIPAAMLDATSAGASLTYETTAGRNGQFLDYGLSLYFDAIAARLSQDDVVAPRRRIAFDTSNVTAVSRSALDPATGQD